MQRLSGVTNPKKKDPKKFAEITNLIISNIFFDVPQLFDVITTQRAQSIKLLKKHRESIAGVWRYISLLKMAN